MGITELEREYPSLQDCQEDRDRQALEVENEALTLQVLLSTWQSEEVA